MNRFRLWTSAAVIALLALSFLSLYAADKKTLTGTVSDLMCGAKHMMPGTSAADCTRACVKEGSSYALVVGSKVYKLKGDKDQLYKLAGQEVKVTGTVTGDTVEAASVEPVPGKKP